MEIPLFKSLTNENNKHATPKKYISSGFYFLFHHNDFYRFDFKLPANRSFAVNFIVPEECGEGHFVSRCRIIVFKQANRLFIAF